MYGEHTLAPGEQKQVNVTNVAPDEAIVITFLTRKTRRTARYTPSVTTVRFWVCEQLHNRGAQATGPQAPTSVADASPDS